MYALLALEIARQRALEADRHARHHLGGHQRAFADPGVERRRPGGRTRAIVARPIRALGAASHALSVAARSAATRIEGSPG